MKNIDDALQAGLITPNEARNMVSGYWSGSYGMPMILERPRKRGNCEYCGRKQRPSFVENCIGCGAPPK